MASGTLVAAAGFRTNRECSFATPSIPCSPGFTITDHLRSNVLACRPQVTQKLNLPETAGSLFIVQDGTNETSAEVTNRWYPQAVVAGTHISTPSEVGRP